MDNSLLKSFLQGKKGFSEKKKKTKTNEDSNLFKTLHLHPQAFLSVQAHLINIILSPD